LKKGDIFVIAAVCILAAALAGVFFALKKDGKTVLVKVDNEVVCEYPLDTDREIVLEHNTAVIRNGEAYMREADCKNQICVKSGKISKRGECIVCLPNRVILEIK
jgi:hypothetical protein